MGKKPKAPKGAARAGSKGGKVASTPRSTQNENPHFCFQFADRATQEAWRFKPSEGHAPPLVDFICEMAKLTWAQIEAQRVNEKGKSHKRHHSQEIHRLTSAAQKDLQKSKLPDRFDDTMFRFRVAGAQRLWGFRRAHVFHVVWWDPDHQVYPTEKAHT
jgi:hypothetical protein